MELNTLQARYRRLLLALLPPGLAWPLEGDSWLDGVLHPIAEELVEAHLRNDRLLAESDPRRAELMIDDWEASLGLPDACSSAAATLAERRAAVIARLLAHGGQRLARYRALAAALGYAGVTFSRLEPLISGFQAGGECATEDVRFAFVVTLPAGAAALECQIRRAAHAESWPVFKYV